MKTPIAAIGIPPASLISRHLPGSYFHDCYELPIDSAAPSALQIYLDMVAKTPAWVDSLMALRNRIVSMIGLKNLGHLGAVASAKRASDYRVGDRVGIFSIQQLSDEEVVLGESDKHLDARVSVCKLTAGGRPTVAVSTVVHIHNWLGRLYMLPVTPVHKLIVPAMLRRASSRVHGA
jgi:hypothetical protein